MNLRFREAAAGDEPRWRELWDGYTRFYLREPNEEITKNTWRRILDPQSTVHAIVAVSPHDRIVGIAHYIIHENTSTLNPVCYLQDLYVDPLIRGEGIGEQMLVWLRDQMPAEGWSRLYWNTRETNYRAREMYDKFTPHTGFLKYSLANPTTGGL